MSTVTLNKQTRLPHEDLSGQQYGRWTILRFGGRDASRNAHWHCRCQCGETGLVRDRDLINGVSRSCGCLRRELAAERQQKAKLAEAEPLPSGTYGNGLRPYSAQQTLDQPSLRKRLADRARMLRPDGDPIQRPLRPAHSRTDGLARACAILAQRYPSEDHLFDLRFALEMAKLNDLAERVWRISRGARYAEELNLIRRLLVEALSK